MFEVLYKHGADEKMLMPIASEWRWKTPSKFDSKATNHTNSNELLF